MIIDTHVHIGGEALDFHMNEEMVIKAMETYGVDFSIVSNADAGEVDHKQVLLPEELQKHFIRKSQNIFLIFVIGKLITP